MSATSVSSDTRLEINRTFKAPAKKVFEALTQPEIMSRWMAPSPEMACEVTSDPKIGGSYRVKMTATDGAEHIAFGTYREVDPFSHIAYTWSWETNETKDTIITIDLEENNGATEMRFIHERFLDAETRDKHNEGWIGCFAQLQNYIDA